MDRMDRKVISIKPMGEFSGEILTDLVSQGYEGQELLQEFKEMRQKMRLAIEAMREMSEKFPNAVTLEDILNEGEEDVYKPDGYFDEEILADMLSQGYEGDELLEKFEETRWKIRPAVEAMLADIDRMLENGELLRLTNVDDIWGKDDDEE